MALEDAAVEVDEGVDDAGAVEAGFDLTDFGLDAAGDEFSVGSGEEEAPPSVEPSESAPASPAEPTISDLQQRLQQYEQRFEQLTQQTQPFLEQQRQWARTQNNRLPELRQKIERGAANTAELLEFMELRDQDSSARLSAQAMYSARSAASQADARGRFTADKMGSGNEYDNLVTRYLHPAYNMNPQLRQLAAALVPDNPAHGEYLWASMAKLLEANAWDIEKAAGVMHKAMGAKSSAAKDLVERVRDVEKRGAKRVHGSETQVSGGRRKLKPGDISRMSEDEFDRLEADSMM